MPRGGYQPGGGRPKGATNIKNRELITAYLKDGDTLPLEIFMSCMRSAWRAAEKAPDMHAKTEAIRIATFYAEKAAPFMHPKLQNIEITEAQEQLQPLKIIIDKTEMREIMREFNNTY